LPFKKINNKRSFVFIGNLCDLILTILNTEKSRNKIFFVSDDEDISTSDLIDKISSRLKIFPKIFYLNKKFIFFIAKTVGKKSVMNQLFESFQIDLSFTKETLKWRPKFSIDEGIEKSLR
jgi:nucleoside-diphosphate-sugar epimerase